MRMPSRMPNRSKLRQLAQKTRESARKAELAAFRDWQKTLERKGKGLNKAEKLLRQLEKRIDKAMKDRAATAEAGAELAELFRDACAEIVMFKEIPVKPGLPEPPKATMQLGSMAVAVTAAMAWIIAVRIYRAVAQEVAGEDGPEAVGKAG
jgi:hypothetical protein